MAENFQKEINNLGEENLKNKLLQLKEGLDPPSQAEIDLFLKRKKAVSVNKLKNQRSQFTEAEKIEQRQAYKQSKIDRQKFNLKKLGIKDYNVEAFYGLSGLRWLPEIVKDKLKQGIFLDVGAYDGDSALALMDFFKPRKIYAFEPANFNFQLLEKHTRGYRNIIEAIPYGLADKTVNTKITRAGSGATISETGDETASLITLTDFIKERSLDKVALIKIDVEGFERKVLEGAKEIIQRDKPIIAVAIYHSLDDFLNIKLWLAEFLPAYKFIIKKANPFSLTHELMLIAY